MNKGPFLFLGLLIAMAISLLAFVLGPMIQIGKATPEPLIGDAEVLYPPARPGQAGQGARPRAWRDSTSDERRPGGFRRSGDARAARGGR